MHYRFFMPAILAALLCLGLTTPARAQAVKVQLVQRDGQWQLLRDGKPYVIHGAGGDASKPLLKECGGNSFRTWGVGADTQKLLDEAQRLGLTVTVGIWLGHKEHGFNYNNAQQVAEQVEQVRQAVLKFKDHPALLMWDLGNEMEGYEDGDNAAIWTHIQNLAVMVHKLDPNHPTMTTIAEIGGKRVWSIEHLCPDIDIIGINTYAGGPSIPQRYKEQGGKKPYIMTEYGPAGVWEMGRNGWGAAEEPTSTAKAQSYLASYEANVVNNAAQCLGAYAFTWGSKQEATATWFGMILPDGSRTASVDAMTQAWTGHPAPNLCPRIDSMATEGSGDVEPGATVHINLKAGDPENDSVKVEWILHADAKDYNTGGATQDPTAKFPDAVTNASITGADIKMPEIPGSYRVYVYLHDDHGGAAVANVPLHVKGQAPAHVAIKPVAGNTSKLPLIVYAEKGQPIPYIASGWMGDTGDIGMDEGCTIDPHDGQTCIKAQFRKAGGWGGVVWQDPVNDWGEQPGGKNIAGATKLTFWARGENGSEKVKFGFGLLGNDKPYYDTAKGDTEVTLTKDWKQYSIDLTGKDLTRIKTGFMWVLGGQGHPVTFYLDDIQYE